MYYSLIHQTDIFASNRNYAAKLDLKLLYLCIKQLLCTTNKSTWKYINMSQLFLFVLFMHYVHFNFYIRFYAN